MKNFVKVAVVAAGIFSFAAAHAQTHDDKQSGVSKTAKDVGHATSHAAASGFAAVKDRTYKDKCGPQGQTVYIDKNSHYYYISKKGHKVYQRKSQLMDKKM